MDSRIFVRLSEADKRRLRKIARTRRTCLSAVVRELIVGAIAAASSDNGKQRAS
jgi:hypothetical protein